MCQLKCQIRFKGKFKKVQNVRIRACTTLATYFIYLQVATETPVNITVLKAFSRFVCLGDGPKKVSKEIL